MSTSPTIAAAGRALTALAALLPAATPAADDAAMAGFVLNYCIDCHDEASAKGDVILEPLIDAPRITDPANAVLWRDVLDQLNLGEMPPKKKEQPPAGELLGITRWLTGELEDYYRKADPGASPTLRRLNRAEYSNTIRDLFGIAFDPGERFPADETADGFDNIGEVLTVSPTLFERYLEAAEEITAKAIVSGPKPARVHTRSSGKQIDCELGIRRGEGIEIASNRENRARVFPVDPVSREGDYRIRVHVTPVRSNGKTLTVKMKTGPADPELTVPMKFVEAFDLTKPRSFESTVRIPAGETVHFSFANGSGIPTIGAQRSYKGPAVIIGEIEVDGPIIEEWPPAGHRAIFAPAEGRRNEAGAQAILRAFARNAFRRNPAGEQLQPLLATFRAERAEGASFEDAIASALQVALCSPHFIFLHLPDGATPSGKEQLDANGLATRLAYFLWSSTPDQALIRTANSGKLLEDPGELGRQARRMLADPKAGAFLENFVGQWLLTREVGKMKPDPRLFPGYDRELEHSMRRETEMFIGHLISANRSIHEVLDSDYTFLNERLARHYGIDGVTGDAFRKVPLPPASGRGGILGHASFLTITSNGTTTSPVMRGIYVLEHLLGTPPPPPPPDVEPIEPDTRGTTTIREQLARHREVPTCFDCHQRIDPIGFTLEGFDPIGARRTHYKLPGRKPRKGPAVETHAETADGTTLADAGALREYLLARKELHARNLTEKLLVYGTGRKLGFLDEREAERIAAKLDKNGDGFRTLLLAVIQSEAFRKP